ncbi:UDP-galactopyranose mutase [Muribaculaceae bacterium Isolate-114 (HZI)]|nr:UDP-galactopyranose mutase [Muribaculaceae bacterium Isolate-114 (HZI)]
MSSKRTKYDYLIVGAGLFGSTFAYLASQAGKKCLVIDKRNHVGGCCYSRRSFGIDVHLYGPHIFHTSNKETWEFVDSLSPMRPFYNQPLAFYRGEIFNLPFNMNTFRQIYGEYLPENIERLIKKDLILTDEPTNLEEYALATVGKTIYDKLIKGYTEKQWGKKCSDLPASLIKRLPLRMTYDNTYFSDQYQGVPKNGYDHLFNQLLKDCDVAVGYDYFGNPDLFSHIADRTLYTGRLDELFGEKTLEFRGLKFEHKILPVLNHQGCAVINYTDSCLPYTRITEHKHFNPVQDSKCCTIITYETPVSGSDTGAIECYPIPTKRNLKIHEMYCGKVLNVIFGGRLADYRYYNMDTTIEKAIQLWKREQMS